jgi:hypothetical protein
LCCYFRSVVDLSITGQQGLIMVDIAAVAGKDAETVFNEKGAGQSRVDARFDLVDGRAMFAMAKVLHEGAVKYGANNWRGIDIDDHLNHLIMHAYAYLAGDRSDDHLSHIMCRAMFAQAVDIAETEQEALEDDFGRTPTSVIEYQGYKFESIEEIARFLDNRTVKEKGYVINPDQK